MGWHGKREFSNPKWELEVRCLSFCQQHYAKLTFGSIIKSISNVILQTLNCKYQGHLEHSGWRKTWPTIPERQYLMIFNQVENNTEETKEPKFKEINVQNCFTTVWMYTVKIISQKNPQSGVACQSPSHHLPGRPRSLRWTPLCLSTPGTPASWFCMSLCPTKDSAFLSIFVFFHLLWASLLIFNLLARWLVPPVEPRHWSLVPLSETQLVGCQCLWQKSSRSPGAGN